MVKQMTPQWIRPAEWMLLTGMPKSPTYRALQSGELRSVRIGRTIFIPFDEVTSYFERARVAA